MNIEIATNVNQRADELRGQVKDMASLMTEEFQALRLKIGKALEMEDDELKKEINVVLEEIHSDVKIIKANQEKILAAVNKESEGESLEYVLEPMKAVDDQLIEEYVSRFTKGTRQWAFDAFDTWCLAECPLTIN